MMSLDCSYVVGRESCWKTFCDMRDIDSQVRETWDNQPPEIQSEWRTGEMGMRSSLLELGE